MKRKYFDRLGPNQKKVLLLLYGGVGLALAGSPRKYFGVIKNMADEWSNINELALNRAIKSLYQSRLIEERVNDNGSTTIVLSEEGKRKALTFNIETMQVKKPDSWDNKWRMVLFDIPNSRKRERDAVRSTLKRAGFQVYQKSAFISPYDCKNELEYIAEFFRVRPYIRFLEVASLDDELKFKKDFGLV